MEASPKGFRVECSGFRDGAGAIKVAVRAILNGLLGGLLRELLRGSRRASVQKGI